MCLVFVQHFVLVVFKMGLLFGLTQPALFVMIIGRQSKTQDVFLIKLKWMTLVMQEFCSRPHDLDYIMHLYEMTLKSFHGEVGKPLFPSIH